MGARVRRRPPLSRRATMDWRSGWRRRCWFAMVLQPSRDGFGIAQAGRQRTALSDCTSERSWSVGSSRMESGQLALTRLCAKASFQVGSNAALQPPCGSHDAGLPRRRRRCKSDRTPRPCWPAAALMAPQTRHVATMGVVDRLPSALACGRCAGSATPVGAGVGASGCENALRPSGPSLPPPRIAAAAALAPSSAMRVQL